MSRLFIISHLTYHLSDQSDSVHFPLATLVRGGIVRKVT